MNSVVVILIFGAIMSLAAASLPHIIWLLGYPLSKLAGRHLNYTPFAYISIGLAAAVILALAYGFFFGRWNLEVKKLEYHNNGLPASFNGFRIVHISDLHLKMFSNAPDKLQSIIDTINAQQADLVCFTGDLITINQTEAEECTHILKGIKAKYGVASVLGNHDFLVYGDNYETDEERYKAVDELAQFERNELGWNLLRDSSMVISSNDGRSITIVGVDNKNFANQEGFKTVNEGNLNKAMSGVSGFTILLTHDPMHWDFEVLPQTGIPLTLSGHTHNAQVSLFGWSPASLMFKRAYGLYTVANQSIYVNPGLSCTIPFRIGSRPEITVITLKCR